MRSRKLNSSRRKRLRLELLENRSLLTGAPWMFFDHVEFQVIDFNFGEGEMAGEVECNHGNRGDSDRIKLALMMLGGDDSSLDSLASGEGHGDSGMQPEGEPLDSEPMGEPLGSMNGGLNSNADGNTDLVADGEGTGEMEMSPPSVEHIMNFGSPQNALRAMTGTMLQPEGEAVSAPVTSGQDVMLPPSSNLATPIVESDDALLFDVAQANNKTNPASSFLAEPFQYTTDSNVNFRSPDSLRQSQFDLALEGLDETLHLKESAEQYSEAELERLLENLSLDEQSTPAAQHETAQVIEEPESTLPRDEGEIVVEHIEQAGGMIALDLPQDLLMSDSSLDGEKDQVDAWTSRVALYREHEMVAAKGGSAAHNAAANSTFNNSLNASRKQGDDVADSRFRPIAAATSVAFGAIFIGMKRQRDRERELNAANQKLQ